jgi:chemotaxis family two-component system response regulator Rcp1
MVDDNPADLSLAREALSETSNREMTTLEDGEQALAFLRQRGKYAHCLRPDVVLLDLSLPKKDGLSILAEVKADPDLMRIPVIIFSSSRLGRDIVRCYQLGANCYVSKPGNLNDFFTAVKSIEQFWSGVASLPGEENS